MAYIYKITNTINGKMYIGKTEQTIEKRFQQHCSDSQRDGMSNRPLYKAMRKYGVDFFLSRKLNKQTIQKKEKPIGLNFMGLLKMDIMPLLAVMERNI